MSNVAYFLIIVLSCAVIGIIVGFISLMDHAYLAYRTDQRITAKQFFALYAVSPEKWEFDTYTLRVQYRRDATVQEAVYCCGDHTYGFITTHIYETISFKTYLDALRVKWFFKRKANQKRTAELLKHRAELILAWNKDIEEFTRKFACFTETGTTKG